MDKKTFAKSLPRTKGVYFFCSSRDTRFSPAFAMAPILFPAELGENWGPAVSGMCSLFSLFSPGVKHRGAKQGSVKCKGGASESKVVGSSAEKGVHLLSPSRSPLREVVSLPSPSGDSFCGNRPICSICSHLVSSGHGGYKSPRISLLPHFSLSNSHWPGSSSPKYSICNLSLLCRLCLLGSLGYCQFKKCESCERQGCPIIMSICHEAWHVLGAKWTSFFVFHRVCEELTICFVRALFLYIWNRLLILNSFIPFLPLLLSI